MTLTRNLKALGLVLVAVFAIGAMVASAASAQNGIITSDGPITLKGVNTGPELENSLTVFGQKETLCPTITYTGHKVAVTPHEKIPNNSSSVTITPNPGICRVGGTIRSTVDMNGCDFVFDLGKTTGVADQYAVTTTVVCPAGKHIVETLFTNEDFHLTQKKSFCHITITEKASYDGLLLKDTTNNTFDLTGTIEGVEADKEAISGTTEDAGILCPKETTKIGVWHFDVTITEASGTAIKLSHL